MRSIFAISLLASQILGSTFFPGVTVNKKLGAGAKSTVETFINNNLCADVNIKLLADGGTANCAAGKDGDELTLRWTGSGANQDVQATFKSAHPYTGSPQ